MNCRKKSKKGRRLSQAIRISINEDYKKGHSICELMYKYECSNGPIYRWKDDEVLYKSILGIRKPRTGKPHKPHKPHKSHKPHKPHKPHKRGSERKLHKRGSERKKRTIKKDEKYFEIARKVVELYNKHKSSVKVQKALKDIGIKMSPVTILKRVKEMKEKKSAC